MGKAESARRFQILSLSGGGYRGLHVARILEIIEENIERPIAQHFDLIAGTSIGGIIALALALEIPAQRIRKSLEDVGPNLFPQLPPDFSEIRRLFQRPGFFPKLIYGCCNWRALGAEHKAATKAWYDPTPLAAVLSESEFFGEQKIAALLHPVIVPAVNYSSGMPKFFKTDHHPDFTFDRKLFIKDVALGTSAAPVYFPAHKVGDTRIVDGGLIANDPTHVAVHEAMKFFNVRPALFGDDPSGMDDLRVLSIGTLAPRHFADARRPLDQGLLDWGTGAFELAASAQESMSAFMIDKHMLPGKVFRLPSMDARPEKAPGLADATPVSSEILRASASSLSQYAFGDVRFREFFDHRARLLCDVRNSHSPKENP